MEWFLKVLKKYAVFSGRARRTEYWMFYLIVMLIALILGIIAGLLPSLAKNLNVIVNIYQLAIVVPSLAVGVRRMHDINKSGWFLLIPLYNLVLLVRPGDTGDNQYGPDPKADSCDLTSKPV